MAEQFPIPTEGPFAIPCNVPAEPGWRLLVRHAGEVKVVPIVGWRLAPATVTGGLFGLESTFVLGCAPMVSNEFDGFKSLKETFSPDASDETIAKRIETFRNIFYEGRQ